MELTDDPKREFDRACAIMEIEIASALKYLQRMVLLSGCPSSEFSGKQGAFCNGGSGSISVAV